MALEGLIRLQVYQDAMKLANLVYQEIIPNLPLRKNGDYLRKFVGLLPASQRILQKVMGDSIIRRPFVFVTWQGAP